MGAAVKETAGEVGQTEPASSGASQKENEEMRIRHVPAAVLVASVALLAACSDDSDSSSDTTATTTAARRPTARTATS